MIRTLKVGIAVAMFGAASASADTDIRNVLIPTVTLKGDGQLTRVTCPWEKKLVVELSKEAPAAVIKCIDGGPGVEVGLWTPY